MKLKLHHWIFVAMGLGALVGLSVGTMEASDTRSTLLTVFEFVGQVLFVGALKMIVAPLILFSIVAGITSIASFQEVGRIGAKTLGYYIATTTIAVAIGLMMVHVIRPGHKDASVALRETRSTELVARAAEFQEATGKDPAADANLGEYRTWLLAREGGIHASASEQMKYKRVAAKGGTRTTYQMFVDDIVRPMLANPFSSLANSNSLGIIFWAILLALGIVAVGAAGRPLVDLFQAGNIVILKITNWLMLIAPIAIFCLVAWMVATKGSSVFQSLGWYGLTVVAGIGVHIGVLLTIVSTVGRMHPMTFLRGIREAWAVAFATRSSAATLPVTMRCVTQNLGVSPRVANFTLPVGATVNMDGTALYEGVAVIFLLQIYGGMDDVSIALTAGVTLVIFITAVLASVGAAAVPDAGLITMVLVANAVHLPIYYITFIFAIDALLDMFRTSTNIMGDAVGAVVVDRLERKSEDPEPAPV